MRLGKRLYSLVMFLVVSVLGGLLVAGLAIPAAGLTAEIGKGTATAMDTLPAELETPPPAEKSSVLLGDGSLLVNLYDENRSYVTLDKVSPIMRKAQVAIEDHRFYEHGAMDLFGTLRALVSTARGVTQGASTITQQYVKMVQINAANARGDKVAARKAQENSLGRKVQELRYALAIEKRLTKDQILEGYLNIAFYGDGAYGVEAAAMHYFGVHASKLNLAQAAMLAGLVRNPITTNPVNYPRVAIERRNDVLDRMLELQIITPDQAAAAKQLAFDKSKVRGNVHGCANSRYPFICDYIEKTLIYKTDSLGDTPAERRSNLYRGGLTIKTQIDPKAQNRAQRAITNFVDPRDPVDSVVVMMEPRTGLLVAMAQNRYQMGNAKWQTFWNMAVPYQMGGVNWGGTDGYQAGSTFKAFVVAAALQNGMGANVSYNVKSTIDFKGKTFTSCSGPVVVNKSWRVSGGAGHYNLYSGAANSVNGYFVQLESAGSNLCEATKIAKAVGLQPSKDKRDLVKFYSQIPSFTLGIVEVSPLSLVNAYATFANRGVRGDPVVLKSIKTRDGGDLQVPSANCRQVINPEVADGVNKILQGPWNYGTLGSVRPKPAPQIAGKTGTVDSNQAIWTMGYTPELAAAAMISYSKDPRFRKFWKARGKRYLSHLRLPVSHSYITGFGADVGRNIFRPAFAQAIKAYPNTRFNEPSAATMQGKRVDVPYCGSVASCKTILSRAGFVWTVVSVDSDSPKGTFLGTSPSGSAFYGQSILIQVSKGAKQQPKPSTSSPTPSTPAPTKPPKKGKKG